VIVQQLTIGQVTVRISIYSTYQPVQGARGRKFVEKHMMQNASDIICILSLRLVFRVWWKRQSCCADLFKRLDIDVTAICDSNNDDFICPISQRTSTIPYGEAEERIPQREEVEARSRCIPLVTTAQLSTCGIPSLKHLCLGFVGPYVGDVAALPFLPLPANIKATMLAIAKYAAKLNPP
jgi:hypothetical protein